jgi:hypothetical protein
MWAGLPDVRDRLADFVRYENNQGRVPIVALPEGFEGDRFVREALAQVPEGLCVRESDPRWVVHSTSESSWRQIERDGELRALSELPDRDAGAGGLGFRTLGEPPEFAEYVVLAAIESLAPENVVSSRQKGHVCDDPDAVYVPGVRLYFDCHAIIESGLAVRDGRHTLKAHRRLPLSPFLFCSSSPDDATPVDTDAGWTPRAFTAAANAALREIIGSGD